MSTSIINETSTPVETKPIVEKIKVNGKEIEVTLDELKRDYGKGKAADLKFEEAARLRKEAENLKEAFSKKEINALLNAGWTEDEIEKKAADFLVERAKFKTMDPRQIELMKREQEYKELKREKEERERNEKLAAQRAIEQKEALRIQKEFLKDVERINSSNKTWLDLEDPVILNHVINDITLAAKKYQYDMSVEEAVTRLEEKFSKSKPYKKEYLQKLIKNNINDIDDKDLEAFLDKGAKGLRDRSVEMFKKSESPFAKNTIPQTQSSQTGDMNRVVRDANYYRNIRMGRTNHQNKK